MKSMETCTATAASAHGIFFANRDFKAGGNLDESVHSGFYITEAEGTWTEGVESEVIIKAAGLLSELSLRLTVQPFLLPGVIEKQSLSVFIDGVFLGSYHSQRTEWTELRLAIPGHVQPSDGQFRIVFRHSTPGVPATSGKSSDTRNLAFMFRSLTLTGRQTVPAVHVPSLPEYDDWTNLPDVHRGRDGWLFLIGGSNTVLRYYHDSDYFTDAHAQCWANLLMARAARLQTMGILYLHIAAPDKISVYPDHFGASLPLYHRHPTRLLAEALRDRGAGDLLVDPLPAFARHSERDRLYLKTDTHWTYLAGQTVCELVTDRFGFPRKLDFQSRQFNEYQLAWDLGSKLSPPVLEHYFSVTTSPTVSRFHANHLAIEFEENVRGGRPATHGSIYAAFTNTDPTAIDKIVVIFGDSFMDFQDSNTTTIFAENFREVHFIWSSCIDYDFVAEIGADYVVSELAERFMAVVPHDEYRVIR